MDIESLVRFYAFLAVAGVAAAGGFALLWIRGRERIRELEESLAVEASTPFQTPAIERQLFDALDSVQVQLAALAERQDFTERMLTREANRLRMDDRTPVPTPL